MSPVTPSKDSRVSFWSEKAIAQVATLQQKPLRWTLTFLRDAEPYATSIHAAMALIGGVASLVLALTVWWPFIATAAPMLIVGPMLAGGSVIKSVDRRGERRRRLLKAEKLLKSSKETS